MTVKNQIRNWVKSLGDLRDGFLVAGGIVYILGYLVWSRLYRKPRPASCLKVPIHYSRRFSSTLHLFTLHCI
jgi:hypothetical protein